jgi:hypothetical protein
MINVLLVHILDGKIIHYEGESDCPCFVQPESMRVARREISKRCQTSLQQIVGKQSRLFQSVHAFTDFDVNPTVDG